VTTRRLVANDPALPLDINVMGQSPHVVAYRMWFKKPGQTAWTRFAEGHTSDDISDHHTAGPFEDETKISYWLGIAGNAGTDYRAVVTFSQSGKIVEGGMCSEEGRTDANGGAESKTEVTLT
jgi:hypothetical protein